LKRKGREKKRKKKEVPKSNRYRESIPSMKHMNKSHIKKKKNHMIAPSTHILYTLENKTKDTP
jgi:hypothetical protein